MLVFLCHTLGAALSSWQLQGDSCHNPLMIPLSVCNVQHLSEALKRKEGALLMLYLIALPQKIIHLILVTPMQFWQDSSTGEVRLFLLVWRWCWWWRCLLLTFTCLVHITSKMSLIQSYLLTKTLAGGTWSFPVSADDLPCSRSFKTAGPT